MPWQYFEQTCESEHDHFLEVFVNFKLFPYARAEDIDIIVPLRKEILFFNDVIDAFI